MAFSCHWIQHFSAESAALYVSGRRRVTHNIIVLESSPGSGHFLSLLHHEDRQIGGAYLLLSTRSSLLSPCEAMSFASYADESELKKLDSSVKKNTNLVKKLKQITDEVRASLLEEIRRTNQTKYVSEAVAAIAEANHKPKDLPATVQVRFPALFSCLPLA